jgi:two-component system response regulator YesN
MSFKEKLMHTRIDIARLLLRNTACSISEIAEKTGFLNVSYFSTLFKKITGVNPKRYRSEHSDPDDAGVP